jgi:hypothetical protein
MCSSPLSELPQSQPQPNPGLSSLPLPHPLTQPILVAPLPPSKLVYDLPTRAVLVLTGFSKVLLLLVLSSCLTLN